MEKTYTADTQQQSGLNNDKKESSSGRFKIFKKIPDLTVPLIILFLGTILTTQFKIVRDIGSISKDQALLKQTVKNNYDILYAYATDTGPFDLEITSIKQNIFKFEERQKIIESRQYYRDRVQPLNVFDDHMIFESKGAFPNVR